MAKVLSDEVVPDQEGGKPLVLGSSCRDQKCLARSGAFRKNSEPEGSHQPVLFCGIGLGGQYGL